MSGSSGWSVKHDRFGSIYTTIYLQRYLQRRTHSRYIKVDRTLQQVLPRRSQWNVLSPTRLSTSTAVKCFAFCRSCSRSAGPLVRRQSRDPQSQFQHHIRIDSHPPAVKWWSCDVQVIRRNEAWRQGSSTNHGLDPVSCQLLWNANRNSYAIYQMVLFPVTLSDR